MLRLVILYPSTKNAEFNLDYYTKHHIELVRSLVGEAATRISVYRGVGGPGGAPAAFPISAAIDFPDMPALISALEQHGAQIGQDVPNFTTISPIIQIEEAII